MSLRSAFVSGFALVAAGRASADGRLSATDIPVNLSRPAGVAFGFE